MRSSFLDPAARLLVIALLTVALASCWGDENTPLPAITALEVAPASAAVLVGGALQFSATGRLEDSTTVPWPAATWTATGGTINSSGNYTAGSAPGTYEVTATSDTLTATATVTVTAVPPGSGSLGLDFLSSQFNFPTFVTAPAGDTRLFVVERGGTIRIFKAGAIVGAPFLDITSLVKSDAGEQGLVGMAFDPQYAANGRFFVSYVNQAGRSVLASYTVSGNADVANGASRVERLSVPHPTAYHYAGGLQFGADGFLYMAIGDGGEAADLNGRGQNLTDLLGNILRINVSGAGSYTIPASNPFVGTAGARGEIWAYGLRNPWRFSFDRANGDLYIADVGQETREEINVSPAAGGAGRGANYGWATMEGSTCFQAATCSQTGLTLPVVEYAHDRRCAVTGGYVYRGSAIPSLQGTYFYSDYCLALPRSFRYIGGVATDQRDWPELDPGNQAVSFGEDGAGELYIVTQSAGIYRIVARQAAQR